MTHTCNVYTATGERESWKKAGKLEMRAAVKSCISGSGAAAESWKLRSELEPYVAAIGELENHALES